MLKPSHFHDIDRDDDMGNDVVYSEYDYRMGAAYTDASEMVSMLDQARCLAEHAHEEGWTVEKFEAELDDHLGENAREIEQFSEWIGKDPFC